MKKLIKFVLALTGVLVMIGCAEQSPNMNDFDDTVSYAGWAPKSEIFSMALNTQKTAVSSVQHLPVYKFDTLKDLEQFKLAFQEILTMERGYDEVPSFNDATADYDETFFEENTLMLVYVDANNCTEFDADLNNTDD